MNKRLAGGILRFPPRLLPLIAVFGLLGLLACASAPGKTLPPQLVDPARHPLYTPDKYITAVGRSGDGVNQAEDNARLKVAEQVSTRIESIYKQHMTEEFNKISWQIQKDTRFTHAEMIHIDTASAAKQDGMFLAFAYLSRDEIYQWQMVEYGCLEVEFMQEVESLARLQDDLSAYTTGFRAAQKTFDQLANKAFEIQAVSQKPLPSFSRNIARLQSIESQRVALLRDLKLTVTLEGNLPGQSREVILMALTGALARLDLEAAPGVCEPQKYELRVHADVDCRRGYLGQECLLKMSGTLIHCASGKVLTEVDLSTAEFKGIHSKESEKALPRLYASITPDVLTPMLHRALLDSLPINARGSDEKESYLQ